MTSQATRRRIEGPRPVGATVTDRLVDGRDDVGEASGKALLTAYAALTHRIHECRGNRRAGVCDGPCTPQRAQRDVIEAEVLRRMGETR